MEGGQRIIEKNRKRRGQDHKTKDGGGGKRRKKKRKKASGKKKRGGASEWHVGLDTGGGEEIGRNKKARKWCHNQRSKCLGRKGEGQTVKNGCTLRTDLGRREKKKKEKKKRSLVEGTENGETG